VAAVLRLQARRLTVPEGRAALEEAVRRVGSIALVHELLSTTLDESLPFDQVAERVISAVTELASGGGQVHLVRSGSFGVIPADVATPLAVVLSELVQNAVEHGLDGRPGTLEVGATRVEDRLLVEVADDGVGLPEGFDPLTSDRLGLQIVRTLVEGELGGQLALTRRVAGGTSVTLNLPLTGGSAAGSGGSGVDRRWIGGGSGHAGAGTGRAALEGAALVLGQAAPDAVILTGLEGPLQAGLTHLATAADEFGLLDLEKGWSGVADREEELGIFVTASGTVTPVHAAVTPSDVEGEQRTGGCPL